MGLLNENFELSLYKILAYCNQDEIKSFEGLDIGNPALENHILLELLEVELALSDKGSIDIDEPVARRLHSMLPYTNRVMRNMIDEEDDFFTTLEDDWWDGYEDGQETEYKYQLWRA